MNANLIDNAIYEKYDIVITTQNEFDEFCQMLDMGTCRAKSVLFVGDGGNLKFIRSKKGLNIPDSLYQIDGINNAIIEITSLASNDAGIEYLNKSDNNLYRINDLTIRVEGIAEPNRYIYAFRNCANLTNCTGYVEYNRFSTVNEDIYPFYNCINLNKCAGYGKSYQIDNHSYEKAAIVLKELQLKKDYDYHYTICACIKDEEEYLDEWVKYHLSIGFEHIWLYDNRSQNSVEEYCKNKEWADKVTVIKWEISKYPQKAAYQDFINKNHNVEWVAFIDIDEYFDLKTNKNIAELMNRYKDYSAVHFTWEIYNASGQAKKEKGTLRERFSEIVQNPDWFDGKYICRPSTVNTPLVHKPVLKVGHKYIDSHYQKKNYDGPNNQTDICTIAHYFTKSLEEWLNKIKRGSVDRDMCRKYADFFLFNPDMIEYCDENFMDKIQGYPEQLLEKK